MKKFFLVCALIGFTTVNYAQSKCLDVYIIRHGEKSDNDPKDPDLSDKGIERANEWANFFQHVNFDAIYVSPRKRTNQTAQPIAISKSLKIQEYAIGNEVEHFEKELQNNSQKVLLVGHSNSIPKFVGKLMNQEFEHIDETNFGQFWMVNYCPKNPEMNSLDIFQLP